MANVSVMVARSDLYPPGTVVKAFKRTSDHANQDAKPSGSPIAEGTVAANGQLSLSVPTAAHYVLWAEVAGKNVLAAMGAQPYVAPPATIPAKISALRAELGC